MTEPCAICCPEEQIPPRIRDIALALRAEKPHDLGQRLTHMPLPDTPFWRGWAQCWNCFGKKEISVDDRVCR